MHSMVMQGHNFIYQIKINNKNFILEKFLVKDFISFDLILIYFFKYFILFYFIFYLILDYLPKISQTLVLTLKEQNIGNYGYIGTWILRKYRKYHKISVDILTKISVIQKLTKIL